MFTKSFTEKYPSIKQILINKDNFLEYIYMLVRFYTQSIVLCHGIRDIQIF